jgi:hypothetical protein
MWLRLRSRNQRVLTLSDGIQSHLRVLRAHHHGAMHVLRILDRELMHPRTQNVLMQFRASNRGEA